MHEQTYKLYKV